MIRLLQISDTHFGTERPEVMNAISQLCAEHKPDLVILSGDITQRARRGQFAAAREFTNQLHAPLLSVPGNHDLPLFNLFARAFSPYGNYRRFFGHDLEPEFETEQLLVIGVNSTRTRRHKDGELSDQQITRVAQRLKQASPEQLRVVVQHHPVRAIEASDTANLIIGREKAVPAWVDAGMDLVLAGHIHLPYVLPLYGQQGEDGRQAWTVQAGTAVSERVRGEISNSVNLICYQSIQSNLECVVERWDYVHGSQRFESALSTAVAISRDRT
ncbi:metallophosphoesterase family protein [Halopseudomonas pelagia]|uniref:metallophosphoesterase family protein n=1 Tax=Halopseudomonas pelagia TaxID=553151 RepID=UPI0003A28530|nr:metallophosphoesterase [Halopseudomonas pelagia]|tara:strand:+ start:647 stop:1462 length:816 start_codon:yes stop_codon:yes gene_type:complete